MQSKKAFIATLGCRLNQADSALLCARLKSIGYEVVEDGKDNDISLVVVNSCSVTNTAFSKSRRLVATLRSRHPHAKIVLAGCSVEIDADSWQESDAIDCLVSNRQKPMLAEILSGDSVKDLQPLEKQPVFKERVCAEFPFKSRANLKIQEGCNSKCTYCVVPRARGPERSRDASEVMEDYKGLLAKGFKEIVLAGVNI